MKIAVGNDHGGYEIKLVVLEWLEEHGYKYRNFGCDSAESVDYPDYIHPVAEAVENGEYDYGVVVCGSGQGASFTANKHQGIRAALCWIPEIAELARQHNNANILAMPGRFINREEAIAIMETFFSTSFEGGRHQTRIDKAPLK
ncbi:MAG: ribose 5-phosphate isomerase B [Bacteroidota bacterium]